MSLQKTMHDIFRNRWRKSQDVLFSYILSLCMTSDHKKESNPCFSFFSYDWINDTVFIGNFSVLFLKTGSPHVALADLDISVEI